LKKLKQQEMRSRKWTQVKGAAEATRKVGLKIKAEAVRNEEQEEDDDDVP